MTVPNQVGPEARCVPVTPARWPDLEAFFGPRGAYGQCWCTYFRQRPADFDAGCRDGGTGNRELLRRITTEGRVPGLIAYHGDEPVGWVSVAPRLEFPRILRSPRLRPQPATEAADPAVWSVVCFWVPRRHRGQGVATHLLDAAVTHAAEGGARVLETYPVEDDSGAPASLYTGTVSMFSRAGFATTRRPAGRRVVMQRTL